MKKSLFRGGVVALFAIGLMFGFLGTVEAKKKSIFGPCSTSKKCQDKPISLATIGGMTLGGKIATSLKGRVYSHWADNPNGEILFGIQYWNTKKKSLFRGGVVALFAIGLLFGFLGTLPPLRSGRHG